MIKRLQHYLARLPQSLALQLLPRRNYFKKHLDKIRLSCCIYLNNVSLLLHTRFRTTSFQQNNPISTKMAESKTLCSIYEVTRDEDLKVPFAPLCTLVSSSNVFLLYRTTNASLLSPQTTSIQNPILQITEGRKLDQINQDTTHEINGSVIIFVFPCKTYDA